MDANLQIRAIQKAFYKIEAVLTGMKKAPVMMGALARKAWGASRDATGIELLASSTEADRNPILSGARGEGFQQITDAPTTPGGDLRFRFKDAKTGAETTLDLYETSTPFLKQMHGRATPGGVLEMQANVATPDDLILLALKSDAPEDRQSVIELLRSNASRINPQYLKKEAEAAGTFDKLKSAWQDAKKT